MIRVKNKHNASSWLLTLGLVLALSIITSCFGLAWPSPIEAQATLPPRHDAFPVRDQPSGPVVHVPIILLLMSIMTTSMDILFITNGDTVVTFGASIWPNIIRYNGIFTE